MLSGVRFVTLCCYMLFMYLPDGYAFEVDFESDSGLFQIQDETDALVKSHYIGWTSGWKWDGPKVVRSAVSPQSNSASEQLYLLTFPRQGVNSSVELSRDEGNVNYNYLMNFNKPLLDTIGGGIEFNLDLKSPRLTGKTAKPYLLPDNGGWGWEIVPGKKIVVQVLPAAASVYFERGNASKIRVMLFNDSLKKGKRQVNIKISLPQNTQIADISKVGAQSDTDHWLKDALDPEKAFIDLSYLNDKPAGKHGFVRADGARLIFEDGQEARFFGVNLQAYSLFIRDRALIKQHAQRLARLGVNLVRLHHHDSATWVKPSLIKEGATTQQINQESLDSYFWWIKCLRDEGIYVWVDLQGMRPWRKDDNIPGWDTDMAKHARKGMSVSKGFVYVNKRMQKLTRQFNEEILTRVNPYTQLALKDDPAVMGIMLTNENELTHHFGNNFLADKGHPYHQALFEQEVAAFSKTHNIDPYLLNRTWLAGPSKLLLNDLEARYNRSMISHLRSIGVRVPIATTNLWGNPLFSLPALTTGEMIDTHGYAGKDLLRKNPRYSPNFIHWLGQGQVTGMPMTVSEYNVGEKSAQDEGHIIVPYVATMAAFQGWDAVMLYGYSQDAFRGGKFSPWSSYLNPAITGLMPSAALLYREQHVAPARETYVISLNGDIRDGRGSEYIAGKWAGTLLKVADFLSLSQKTDSPGSLKKDTGGNLFFDTVSPETSATLRTLMEQHRIAIAMPQTDTLPWLEPSEIPDSATVIKDPNRDTLPLNQGHTLSDTGEIRRDWGMGILTIDSPKSQAAIGEIGGNKIELTDVTLEISTQQATVILTSLDGRELFQSKKILLSTAAGVKLARYKDKVTILSEPVSGNIELNSIVKKLKLYPLLAGGLRGNPVPLQYKTNNSYMVKLPENPISHWYVLAK